MSQVPTPVQSACGADEGHAQGVRTGPEDRRDKAPSTATNGSHVPVSGDKQRQQQPRVCVRVAGVPITSKRLLSLGRPL